MVFQEVSENQPPIKCGVLKCDSESSRLTAVTQFFFFDKSDYAFHYQKENTIQNSKPKFQN